MAANANGFVILNEIDPRFTYTPAVVASGAVGTIAQGTPTKGADATAATWTGAVLPMVDGDGTTSQRFTGIAKNTSSETASVAGLVTLWMPLPGIIYAGKSKLASDVNTAAKLLTFFGKRVVFDLTTSVWTVDSGAADAAANSVVIVGGDFNTSMVWFNYKYTNTSLGQIA